MFRRYPKKIQNLNIIKWKGGARTDFAKYCSWLNFWLTNKILKNNRELAELEYQLEKIEFIDRGVKPTEFLLSQIDMVKQKRIQNELDKQKYKKFIVNIKKLLQCEKFIKYKY